MPYTRSRTSTECLRIDQLRRHLLLWVSWIVEGSLYRDESSVGEDVEKSCLITNIIVAFSDGVFADDAPLKLLEATRAYIFQLDFSYIGNFNATTEGSNAKENGATEVRRARAIDTKTCLGWTLLGRMRCMSGVVDIAELYHPSCPQQ